MAEDEEANCISNSMQLFRTTISANLETIAESVSKDEFLEIFTFLKSDPSKATKLHKVMVKELYSDMMRDFEVILNEGSLKSALTKINRLSKEYITLPKDAWRPPGDVTSHMKSLDADIMKRAIEELKKEVDEMEGRNEILKKKVTEGRSRICALNGSIERHFNNARIIFERLEKTYDQLRSINGVEVIGSE